MVYSVLKKQTYHYNEYSIVPLRFEDRLDIMKWRNEQIYHLRQTKPLKIEDQNSYFENVVSKLFDQEKPNQLLFSFLKDDACIGYGGLVHINWIDMHAEISFVMNTSLEKEEFSKLWSIYLNLINELAFDELNLHKIFTYAFDIRKQLYPVLEKNGLIHETTLHEHVKFEGKMINVLIHSKTNKKPKLHKASLEDIHTTFDWANNEIIRAHSFTKEKISFEHHQKWFLQKIKSPLCHYFILKTGLQPIGSVRVDEVLAKKEGVISFLIDENYHGKGFGKVILKLLELELKDKGVKTFDLIGLVQEDNLASVNTFKKLNYQEESEDNGVKRFTKRI